MAKICVFVPAPVGRAEALVCGGKMRQSLPVTTEEETKKKFGKFYIFDEPEDKPSSA